MPVRSALTPTTAVAALGGTNIGTAVPADHRRYVYSIKTENQFAGPNVLTLSVGAVNVDVIFHLALGDMREDPEVLLENSLPIYILEAAEQLVGTPDAGDCFVKILFVDAVD